VVAVGALQKVAACDGYVSLRIAGRGLHDDQRAGLIQRATAAIRLYAQQSGDELHDVHVEIVDDAPSHLNAAAQKKPASPVPPAQQPPKPEALPGVRHIIAVGAGKGGVGKSTVSVNLAVGLARRGHAVGLMDGDIYGPSMPTMLGLEAADVSVRGTMIEPFNVHGIKSMTIGKLVEPDKPLIWRGPMAHGAFKQLVEQTNWGELDYLVIDLPPGTGDVSLTMAQLLRLTGAVVVCTPQKVAQDDAVRAARMFQQLGIDVLGVVENMSYFVGDDAKEYDLFGRGGAQLMAQRLNLPFLGAVPITIALREHSDAGEPTRNFTDRSARNQPLTAALEALVDNLEKQVALAGMKSGRTRPTLSIS
jgi:ATP-binding protein involved in chromosome partitioning